MTELVSFNREGTIGLIVADNPPVNALKHELRAKLVEAFSAARDDKFIEAVVLTCAGRTFIAGADITEFGKPPKPPSLLDLIAIIDAMPKPVVAAMHGTPLGGGFEIALACHFRVAAPGTRLGLPEIKLGLIPGAGGTQRLPRLIGPEKALRMILSGDLVLANEALADGLIDAILGGELVNSAVEFARKVVSERRPLKRVSNIDEKLVGARNPEALAALVTPAIRRARGSRASAACVQAARAALELPFEQGLKRERELFMELIVGDESKAQRHIFFAEREAAKVSDLPANVQPREIARAAVIGAGTMGSGIAMCFANAGIPVAIIETGKDTLTRGLAAIAKNYKSTVARGGITQQEMEQRVGLIAGATELEAVSSADFVIEAVFEEMDIKKQVFGALDRLAKEDAVLATNTSYLDVNAIATTTRRPQDVLGTHFFSPANVMRLLEIVRGKATAPDVLATAIAAGRRIGKVPVVVGVCHGFVGNRMLGPRSKQAERLLIEGALPQDVDAALVEFGFPMGPFAVGDLAGLDVGWRNRKALGVRAEIADALCEAGHFGQKTGKGFYRYEAGSRTPIADPEVEKLIVETSKRLGVARRPIGKEEIIERMNFPMINEGARILEEGIAQRPGDIDVIWVHGYGWPAWRGGPMFHADLLGLAHIRDRLAQFSTSSGDKTLEPAPLLVRLAGEGRGFGSLFGKEKAA
jgi:3-hydroxyacyl-CoA dehydrogenase